MDRIRHGFPGTVLLWVLKNFAPVSRKIRFGSPNAPPPPFSKLPKRDISANVFEHFDFPTVGKKQNRGTATDKGGERMCGVGLRRVCGGKSVGELCV